MPGTTPNQSADSQCLELLWPSDLTDFRPHRATVARFLEERLYSRSLAEDLLLVIDEAVSNAVRHSYAGETGHAVRLEIRLDQAGTLCHLQVEITDQGVYGRSFDPTERLGIAQEEAGKTVGYGMVLMHRLMDDVCYETTEQGDNRLTLGRWFYNGPLDVRYLQSLISELQAMNVLPAINPATVDELVETYGTMEPGEVIEILGAIKRIDPPTLRRAIARARRQLAEAVPYPGTAS